jgi:LPXTG-motif cell wall-anchored protein
LIGVVPPLPVTPPTTGGDTTTPAGPRLATTGIDTGSTLLVGFGALLVGALALAVSLAASKRSRVRGQKN